MIHSWVWEEKNSANPGDGFIASDQKSLNSVFMHFLFAFLKLVLLLNGQIRNWKSFQVDFFDTLKCKEAQS